MNTTVDNVLKLNFRFAGAVMDVNRLMNKGWKDITGVCPEGEYVRYGSTLVGLAETIDGIRYDVLCAFSETNGKKNEKDGTWSFATNDYIQKAHAGEVPRLAFFRRMQVWACDPKAMTYDRLRGALLNDLAVRVEADLEASLIDPARSLSEDIAFQTEMVDIPEHAASLSSADRCFLKLETILESCKRSSATESVARLLTPFARAVLTDDDQVGRELAFGIASARVISLIVRLGEWCAFPEASVAAYLVARQKGIMDALDAAVFADAVRSVLKMDMPKEAAEALRCFFVQMKKMNDKEDSERLRGRVYLVVKSYCRSLPEDADGLEALVCALEDHLDVYGDNPEPGLLCALTRDYLNKLRGKDVDRKQIDEVAAFLKPYGAQYERIHVEDLKKFPYLKDLSPGVRAPLPWQATIWCLANRPEHALRSFPIPPSGDEQNIPARPAAEAVEGLSACDIWSGLKSVDWDESSWETFEKRVSANLEPCGESVDAEIFWSWLGRMSRVDSYQILESKTKAQEELSAMGVQTKSEDGDGKTLAQTFPFLSKEYPGNVPNVTAKVWRTFIWDDGVAADVQIQLENGRMVTATMPYYVADRRYFFRGIRGKGLLVGFASTLKKLPPPKRRDPIVVTEGPIVEEEGKPVTFHISEHFDDWFAQDTIHESISRAGFGLQGRVKSVRELAAFGEKMLAVEIESIRLDNPLRVYIAAGRVKSALAVGDTVEAFGWLYLDFFEIVDSIDSIKATMNEWGGHLPERPEDSELDSGVPSFVRTEYTEAEKKRFGRMLDLDWYSYGCSRLERIKGVTRVVPCPPNPLHADYLVKRDGKVETYSLIIAHDDEKPCVTYPGTQTVVLRLRKKGKGVQLDWEGIPA